MSPRRKPNQKMKYWGFYASEELKAETIKCAEALNESDSEYIRRAVEQRNAQQIRQYKQEQVNNGGSEIKMILDSTHNTASKPEEDDIPNPKREIKPLPITPFKGVTSTSKRDKMVQSFMKGEKK